MADTMQRPRFGAVRMPDVVPKIQPAKASRIRRMIDFPEVITRTYLPCGRVLGVSCPSHFLYASHPAHQLVFRSVSAARVCCHSADLRALAHSHRAVSGSFSIVCDAATNTRESLTLRLSGK